MRQLLFRSLFTIASCSLPLTEIHSFFAMRVPSFEVSSHSSLVDEEVIIHVKNLEPREEIQLEASSVDDNDLLWKSYGVFQADDFGVVDLSKQSPLTGSYQGSDSMGLFWAMTPSNSEIGASFKVKKDSYAVTFTAYRGEEKLVSKEIIRLRKAADVRKISVQENGLVGILFLPPSEKSLPVIITLSGSNGGFGENRAQLLASHGFAVLALGYFGMEGLPPHLQNIPLEYFETAFTWLKNQSAIDGSRIGIYGASRGAELGLILGCWFPESVQAIVAAVPSSVIYGGLNKTSVHAWLYRGEPLAPFAPVSATDYSGNLGKESQYSANTLKSFLNGMKDTKAFEAAAIPVEKIQASVLLISGGDDQMWPSTFYANQIQERLKNKGSTIVCEHLHYPKAGHGINIPNMPQPGPVYYHPVSKCWFSVGGTIAEDQYASQDSWKKLIVFFQTALKMEDL